jgi:hypothetical protein
MLVSRETIRSESGKIIGYIEEDNCGDKAAVTFYGVVKGYYHKAEDVTTDFSGHFFAEGDKALSLLSSPE